MITKRNNPAVTSAAGGVIYTAGKRFRKPAGIRIRVRDLPADAGCLLSVILAFFPVAIGLAGRWVNYARAVACLMFLAGVAAKDRKLFQKIAVICLAGIVYSCYYFYQVWYLYVAFPGFISKSMFCWLYPCFALYYGKYGRCRFKERMQVFLTLLIILTCITTMIMLVSYPNATRALANARGAEGAPERLLYAGNTASWGIMYGMVFSLPVWADRYRKEKKIRYLLAAVLVTVCAVKAQLTFAIVFAAVFCFFLFMKNISVRRVTGCACILLVLAVVFRVYTGRLFYELYLLLRQTGADTLTLRAHQLYLLCTRGMLTGSTGTRLALYMQSIRTFLEFPLAGCRSDAHQTVVGLHSQLFDTMGAAGLAGTILLAGLYGYLVRYVYRTISDTETKAYFIIAASVLVLFQVVNPVWYAPESFMSVFLFPVLFQKGYQVKHNAIYNYYRRI